MALARALEKSGRMQDAIRELSAASLSNPAKKEIHSELARLYQLVGEGALAEKEMSAAGLNPEDAVIERLTREGARQLLARDYEKAVEAYQAILMKRPRSPDVYESLGDAQMADGHDEEALAAYTKAIGLDPQKVALLYTLGILHERKGMLNEAEADYRKSLQFVPKNGDARRRLADMYTLRGKFREAIGEYTELIKLRGDNPILHFKLARVYERNREFQNAVDEYLTAIRLAPGNIQARKELAALYEKRRLVAEAEEQYQNILRLEPGDREIRNSLLSCYLKSKNIVGSLQLLKDTVQLYPTEANDHYKLGLLYEFNKENESAIAEYQKANDLKSGYPKYLNALGRINIKTGNLEKAKTLLEAARAADPDFFEPRELLDSLREERAPLDVKRAGHHRAGSHRRKMGKKGRATGKNIQGKHKIAVTGKP